jgi:hypothetical protein
MGQNRKPKQKGREPDVKESPRVYNKRKSARRKELANQVIKNAAAELDGHKLVVQRCGEAWSRAYKELRDLEVPFLEFANPNYDCRECPLFMECLTKNHFSHRNWNFTWMNNLNN